MSLLVIMYGVNGLFPVAYHRVIKLGRVIYFDDDTYASQGPREIVFREERVIVPIPVASAPMYDSLISRILRLLMMILLIKRCKRLQILMLMMEILF